MEGWFLDALLLLFPIIVKQAEGKAAQQHDGNEVTSCQEGHEEVDDVPDEFETGQGTEMTITPAEQMR